MKKKAIIKELENIRKLSKMNHKELYENYPFTREFISEDDSIYPALTGLIESELEHLIRRIERNGLK